MAPGAAPSAILNSQSRPFVFVESDGNFRRLGVIPGSILIDRLPDFCRQPGPLLTGVTIRSLAIDKTGIFVNNGIIQGVPDMNPDDFKNSPAGSCVYTPTRYCAFVPNPLPPQIEYDRTLAHLLSDARGMLGELSGAGRRLPNPHILIKPYTKREAVSSSRIEGTQASLDDLYFFEAGELEGQKTSDVREVANYVDAFEQGFRLIGEMPISIRLIREIHHVLMEGVRGGHTPLGELRNTQVWIGPRGCSIHEATYVPPPANEMKQALSEWEKYYHSEASEDPLVQCAFMHYQFEAIHPFEDGNGRVGRLLIILTLCEKQYLSRPLLYLSEFFERHRDEYLRRLLRVSQVGDWRGWLEFFLQGVVTQARYAISDAEKILDLHREYTEKVRRTGKLSANIDYQLVDEIFSNPVLSVSKLSRKLNQQFKTIQRSVDRLIDARILSEYGDRKRNRLFVATELRALLRRPSE